MIDKQALSSLAYISEIDQSSKKEISLLDVASKKVKALSDLLCSKLIYQSIKENKPESVTYPEIIQNPFEVQPSNTLYKQYHYAQRRKMELLDRIGVLENDIKKIGFEFSQADEWESDKLFNKCIELENDLDEEKECLKRITSHLADLEFQIYNDLDDSTY